MPGEMRPAEWMPLRQALEYLRDRGVVESDAVYGSGRQVGKGLAASVLQRADRNVRAIARAALEESEHASLARGRPRAPLETAERAVRHMAELLDASTPPGWLFVVLLASEGEGGLSTYISNAQRTEVVALLRELADHLEQGVRPL